MFRKLSILYLSINIISYKESNTTYFTVFQALLSKRATDRPFSQSHPPFLTFNPILQELEFTLTLSTDPHHLFSMLELRKQHILNCSSVCLSVYHHEENANV